VIVAFLKMKKLDIEVLENASFIQNFLAHLPYLHPNE
jgi:hypothetical protein